MKTGFVEFPLGFKFGMEIEFCSPTPWPFSHEKWPSWHFGTDSSLEPRTEACTQELRNAYPSRFLDICELENLLASLHEANCFTTRSCGIHVHVSHPRTDIMADLFEALKNALKSKVNPFKERIDYCSWWQPTTSHYAAINWCDNSQSHLEIRIFNGSIKLRGILWPLNQIRKEALRVVGASQAADQF